MEYLFKVSLGLWDAEPGIVREDNLLETACERSEMLLGRAISSLLLW